MYNVELTTCTVFVHGSASQSRVWVSHMHAFSTFAAHSLLQWGSQGVSLNMTRHIVKAKHWLLQEDSLYQDNTADHR